MKTIDIDAVGKVMVEDRGEHHMGASTIVVSLPFELDGQREFFTTNGKAVYADATRSLFIHDACMVLHIRLDDFSVTNWMPEQGLLIESITPRDDGLLVKIYEARSPRNGRDLCVGLQEFLAGYGKVRNARFPSAYP
ncbi:hypothetical protein [Massilia sp. TS11]|uniref:hypothetical protein n=1 Tax=Massilia sp. TS11 TaxID=2908003 RepID=UPI001EDB2D78|nr:hypothetical protein [Massilia sp. TS11]MCG2586305.1 hypothetical protein [Massilia sp. TS11]